MHEYNFSVAHDPAKFLTEVTDLRVEIMNKGVMVLVGVVSWLSMPMISSSIPAGNRSSSLIALAAFVLIFACAVLSWQGHPKPALLLCAWGTLTLSLLLSVVSPGYSASLYVVGACVVVALLAGAWHGWAAVLLSGCVVALRMALAPGDQPTMDLAVVTIVGAAMLVYLTQVVIRVLFQTLRWMSEGYEVITRQSNELRDKGAELAGALKSLGQTSFALAHANEQLQVVVKYAEEARASKQAFAASVSHELRAPLNLIIGFSDVILNAPSTYRVDQLPQGLLADVHVIYNNAQHLLKLVDDILDLSQLDMNYLTIIQERVRMDELIKTTLNDVAELATARGLGLTAEVAPELPEIMADRTRIRQVLLNLISNAVRFTDSGRIVVRVAMSQDTEAPGREGAINASMLPVPARAGAAAGLPLSSPSHIVVSVSDTGVGIAPEDLQRIFEPFSQAGTPARKRGGAGLGLTISKQFIELHGGRMWVESRQGAGSTFYFTLPIRPPSPMSNVATSSLSGQRREVSALVVVEPNPLLTRILQRHLSGIPVVHAFHAAEAVACLQAGNAEAVLINTPLEAGVDVASLMLPPHGLETVPVLRCYVPGLVADREAGLNKNNLRRQLPKPIIREKLYEMLHNMLALCARTSWDDPDAGAGRPACLLVVEDDEESLQLLGRLLRSAPSQATPGFNGAIPVEARSVAQALDYLSSFGEATFGEAAFGEDIHIDGVLLDISLGDGSGLTVLQTIDRSPQLRDIPVCIVSAWHTPDESLKTPYVLLSRQEGLTGLELAQSVAALLHVTLPGVDIRAQ